MTKLHSDLHLQKPHPARRWLLLGIAAFVIVALGLWIASIKADNSTDNATKDSPAQFDTAQTLVTAAQQELKGETVEVASITGLGGTTASGYMAFTTPRYRTAGHTFDNLPAESAGAAYKSDSTVADKNYAALTAFFAGNHFKRTQSEQDVILPIAWNRETAAYVAYAIYESNSLVCLLSHADASETALAGHITSIGCGSKASYETAAKTLAPLYAAYVKAVNGAADANVLLGFISSEGEDGNQQAVLYQEDPSSDAEFFFKGRYAKTSSDDTWTYVGRAQE